MKASSRPVPRRNPKRIVHPGTVSGARASTGLEGEALVLLIQKGPTAPGLARALGVSLATVNRLIASLRAKGLDIVIARQNRRWHYQVRFRRSEMEVLDDPLVKGLGSVKRWRAEPGRTEDEIVYAKP